MRFRILGSIGAMSDGREIVLDGSRQRTVLAALLMARGRLTTDQQLIGMLWLWNPPTAATVAENARSTTQVHSLKTGDHHDDEGRAVHGYLVHQT